MDKIVRIVVILALVALSIFRLVRYFRHGVARRVTAIPSGAGMILAETRKPVDLTPTATVRPSRSARILAGLLTAVIWLAANTVIAWVLFLTPMLSSIPVIWRLFVQIFLNFYLYPLAKNLRARWFLRPGGTSAGGSLIGDG
jgi:hypothetical protein